MKVSYHNFTFIEKREYYFSHHKYASDRSLVKIANFVKISYNWDMDNFYIYFKKNWLWRYWRLYNYSLYFF